MSNPLNFKPIQRIAHMVDRRKPAGGPCAQFGNHRVIIHADFTALEHASVIADHMTV